VDYQLENFSQTRLYVFMSYPAHAQSNKSDRSHYLPYVGDNERNETKT